MLLIQINIGLPAGQPKLRSNEVVGEISREWNMLDLEAKVVVTNPLLEELVTWREEVDTRPKITPIHVLNDVTATMAKINQEVRCYL